MSITNIYSRRRCTCWEVVHIPVIQIYLKDETYIVLRNEAAKSGTTIGRFISQILDSYVKYLRERGEWHGEEKV